MQSVVAVACKVVRIFYKILTQGVQYDPGKLLGDIRRGAGTNCVTAGTKTGNTCYGWTEPPADNAGS